MKQSSQKRVKEHYQALRQLSPAALWSNEVPAFNAAKPAERLQNVSVIRAVGVVFSEAGTPHQKTEALVWLRALVQDPEEKIRRYAMAALPKLGSGEAEEKQLLTLANQAVSVKETQFLAKTLERIGGSETLNAALSALPHPLAINPQRLQANIARRQGEDGISMEALLPVFEGLRIALDCRKGVEHFLFDELESSDSLKSIFKIHAVRSGWVELRPKRSFSLNQLYALRCFSAVVFLLPDLPPLPRPGAPLDETALAGVISSNLSTHILGHLSQGAARYRLEFDSRGADPALIQRISETAFKRCPLLLNDSREAPWEIRIHESPNGVYTELHPKLRPDPRFAYRRGDVPAASHPPLAAALARVAGIGTFHTERIWDPFCGSGLELAECLLISKESAVFGTDLSAKAIEVAQANVQAVTGKSSASAAGQFRQCDFREGPAKLGLRDLTLLITNPPLGKRVPVADLEIMVEGVFKLANELLQKGGRLVFVNPLKTRPRHGRLRLRLSHKVDLGFAHFQLEKYVAE